MGTPKTIHTNANEKREKLRRVATLVMKKMESEINNMLADRSINGWDDITRENVINKRKELRTLVEKATVGATPKLEAKICLLACQISYLHDENLRKDVEAGWNL